MKNNRAALLTALLPLILEDETPNKNPFKRSTRKGKDNLGRRDNFQDVVDTFEKMSIWLKSKEKKDEPQARKFSFLEVLAILMLGAPIVMAAYVRLFIALGLLH